MVAGRDWVGASFVTLCPLWLHPAVAPALQKRITALEEERKKHLPLSQLEQEEKERNEAILAKGACDSLE